MLGQSRAGAAQPGRVSGLYVGPRRKRHLGDDAIGEGDGILQIILRRCCRDNFSYAQAGERLGNLECSRQAETTDLERRGALESSPWNTIVPAVGRANPPSIENSVVLPAPFGPMTPNISPRLTSNVASLTAIRPPNAFASPRT